MERAGSEAISGTLGDLSQTQCCSGKFKGQSSSQTLYSPSPKARSSLGHQARIKVAGVRSTVSEAVVEGRWKPGFRRALDQEFRHPFLGDC